MRRARSVRPLTPARAIADIVEKRVGLRATAHQFRHAAGAIILKHEPGNYEFVRRVLGHLNIQTTIRFYTALESFHGDQDLRRDDRRTVQGGKGREAAVRRSPARTPGAPRSLKIDEWSAVDQAAWREALRPPGRLKRGGPAAHLAEETHMDLARRYGMFLDHVQRKFDRNRCFRTKPAGYVTLSMSIPTGPNWRHAWDL